MCRILAEAVPRDKGRTQPARLEQPVRRQTHRENGRLRILGQRQPLLGSLEDDPAEPLAERFIGLVEGLATCRVSLGQRSSHADCL